MSKSRKQCRICGEEKPLDQFPIHILRADGHVSQCKACHARRMRERYAAKKKELGLA